MAPLARPVVGRSIVSTKLGIVAASHPLAARAGTAVLERGGNAVDAAIAANAMIGLIEPGSNGIGGDLFLVYYEARSGKICGLNAGGWSPSGLTPQFLRSKGITEMPSTGIQTVTVPGAVAGWDMLSRRFGTMPLSELLAPAIYYAEEGFTVTEVIAAGWANAEEKLREYPEAARTYLPNGRAPACGEIFRNPRLAQSLRRIAEGGRDGFYKGPTAEAMVRVSAELGGTLAQTDLEEFQPQWVTPIHSTYRGWTIHELPPNTTGIAALMMLNIMEQFPLGDWGFHSTKSLHVMIEAKKLAFADLLRYIGDPGFSKFPVATLLSKSHARDRARLIDMKHAASRVEPARLSGYSTSAGNDTIYLCAIDSQGNIASLIQSIYSGFGSAIVAPETGFALHNRGALFTLEPGHPNTLEPRKLPLHTIIPGFMEKDGVRIGFGIMGGFNQPQAHAQFVAGIADFEFTIQEALEAGRFTKLTFEGCDVDVEPTIPPQVRSELEALGHQLNIAPPRSGMFGWGQAVMSDREGIHYGASEPRHDGAAIPQLGPVYPS
jgi:gamma-glutamyltranspeptidase / glutathione hydrolase